MNVSNADLKRVFNRYIVMAAWEGVDLAEKSNWTSENWEIIKWVLKPDQLKCSRDEKFVIKLEASSEITFYY